MKIAIDVSPLSSGHNIRGVGFYLKNLLKALKKYHSEHEYLEFTDKIPKSVDVIHFSYFDPFSPNLPLLGDKKTVVTVHDLIPLVLPKLFPVGVRGKVHWLRQKFSLQRVGRIITNSNSSKHDIERLAHIPSLKITVTYLAAGEQFKQTSNLKRQTSNVKNKYNLPDIFALYVGDATANKNLPNLVKGILQTDIPLVIAGKTMTDETVDLSHSWTKDINQVRLLAKSNPKKIKLLGFVGDEDLVVLYNLAASLLCRHYMKVLVYQSSKQWRVGAP